MTDQEEIVNLLANANMRYSITVHTEGSSIIVTGKRTEHPALAFPGVEFTFDTNGALLNIGAAK